MPFTRFGSLRWTFVWLSVLLATATALFSVHGYDELYIWKLPIGAQNRLELKVSAGDLWFRLEWKSPHAVTSAIRKWYGFGRAASLSVSADVAAPWFGATPGIKSVWRVYGSFPFALICTIGFLSFIAYPFIVFRQGPLRRYKRYRNGRCTKCGYDLTGNSSGICSECGSPVRTEPVSDRLFRVVFGTLLLIFGSVNLLWAAFYAPVFLMAVFSVIALGLVAGGAYLLTGRTAALCVLLIGLWSIHTGLYNIVSFAIRPDAVRTLSSPRVAFWIAWVGYTCVGAIIAFVGVRNLLRKKPYAHLRPAPAQQPLV